MKIYLYEAHLGGLYLSMRDDLDYICPQCGDSDVILEEYDIDEYDIDDWGDDILSTIKDLLNTVIFYGYTGRVFNELVDNLETIIKDLSLTDIKLDKVKMLKTIKYTRESLTEQVLSFVDTIKEVEE